MKVKASVPTTTYQRIFLRADYYVDENGILRDRTSKYRSLVGGYGTGKTHSLCLRVLQQIQFRDRQGVKHVGIFTAPVHSHFVDVVIPQLNELLDKYKFSYRFNKNEKTYYIRFGRHLHKLHLKSGEQAKRNGIVGINATDAYDDEFDVNENEVQKLLWEQVQARLRQCEDPTRSRSTTPEKLGYSYWLDVRSEYETWDGKKVDNEAPISEYIRAETKDNNFLADPIGYEKQLMKLYTPKQVKAYLKGYYVNLIGDLVWEYYKEEHTVVPGLTPNGTALSGWDFGWNDYMYTCIGTIDRNGEIRIIAEYQANKTLLEIFIKQYKLLCEEHNLYPVVDYCDPAGNQHNEKTGTSNIEEMEFHGLNPEWTTSRIMEGVQLGNNLLHKRKLKVHPRCKKFIAMLENNSYGEEKNGVRSEKPLHDIHESASAVFRYICVNELRYSHDHWNCQINMKKGKGAY